METRTFIKRAFVSAIVGIGVYGILSAITTAIFCMLFDMHPSAEDYDKYYLLLSAWRYGYIFVGIIAYIIMFAELDTKE